MLITFSLFHLWHWQSFQTWHTVATCFLCIWKKPQKNRTGEKARNHLRVCCAWITYMFFVVPLGRMTGRPEEFPSQERVSLEAVFFHSIPEGLPVCAYQPCWNGSSLASVRATCEATWTVCFHHTLLPGFPGNSWVTLPRRGMKLAQRLFVWKSGWLRCFDIDFWVCGTRAANWKIVVFPLTSAAICECCVDDLVTIWTVG